MFSGFFRADFLGFRDLTMVFDHGLTSRMDSVPISKFKATCLAVLERVRLTARPLRVTRFRRPIADIVAPKGRPSCQTRTG